MNFYTYSMYWYHYVFLYIKYISYDVVCWGKDYLKLTQNQRNKSLIRLENTDLKNLQMIKR